MKPPQNERLGEEHPWNSYKSQNQQNHLESPLAPKQFILSKISSRVKEHIYHYVIKIGFRARAPLDEN
jgi:hypothetical protein